MEVRLYPNRSRPGVGLRPRQESQRPFLPQHSRLCPVLEAGSALGYMVYPPLEPNEAFHIEYQGDGRYRFEYLLNPPGGKWQTFFVMEIGLPLGSVGKMRENVTFMVPDSPITEEGASNVARTFFVREDLGTPPGGITLRGATNFRTPPGWDTVYTPVLNMIERPVAPMLVVRVETDWFPQDSEFRYVLQPGEGITGTHSMPIGQVLFVPREEITLIDCTDEEVAEIRNFKEDFLKEKARSKVTTRYGLEHSPHYLRESRSRRAANEESQSEETAEENSDDL